MNWEAVGAIAELLAAMGVILSLIYLAIQVRQNTSASKAATVQDMTNKWVQINLWAAESPERVFRMAEIEPGSNEFMQGLAFHRALFHQWSNNLYQYRRGVLDDASFEPTTREIRFIMHNSRAASSFEIAWDATKHIYNDDFRSFFENMLAERKVETDA